MGLERTPGGPQSCSASAIQPRAVISVLTRKSFQVLLWVFFCSCRRELLTPSFSGIGEHFKPGRQEDAHEFLRCTVDAMQRACLSGSSDLDSSSQATTIVHQIFGGFPRSRVTCLSCKAVSDSYEAFLDIPLDIKAASSVTAALEGFVKPEQLDGESCFKCGKCDKMVAASKRFTIHCVPKVLEREVSQSSTPFHKPLMLGVSCSLPRRGGFPREEKHVVEYPEYLDLRPYTSQTAGEPLLCALYAVLVHRGGSCCAGHYFCYTKVKSSLLPRRGKMWAEEDKYSRQCYWQPGFWGRRSPSQLHGIVFGGLLASNRLWYKMNDPSVDGCGTDTVLRQQGYLLFYVRRPDAGEERLSPSPDPRDAMYLFRVMVDGCTGSCGSLLDCVLPSVPQQQQGLFRRAALWLGSAQTLPLQSVSLSQAQDLAIVLLLS
ncbi:hypothetical protein QYF61_005483 [Mycteria americana]|uniref:USP domain-containing protein n=1 Tax=Mycteria americana TaxID=33587 RepID=A0AAN7MKX3_MYCAM|nr:hypothetical protein QYF61_005483 [Mycteria americana]